MHTRKFNKTLLFIPALLAISIWVFAADREIERTFEVNPKEALRVASDMGSITVQTHNRDTVKVAVEIEGMDEEDFKVDMDYRDGEVAIIGTRKRKSFSWGNTRVRFHIQVPREFDLDLNTRGGSIQVRDLQGVVRAGTSGGSLTFEDINGNINARTSGGSITVDQVEGEVKIKTSGGSIGVGTIQGNLVGHTSGGGIRIESISGEAQVSTSGGSINVEAVGESLQAKTSGGSITAVFPQQPKSACELITSAGSVTAVLNEDIQVNVNAQGFRVRSDFPVDGDHNSGKKLKGAINGGGPQLELRTSAGSVNIVKG